MKEVTNLTCEVCGLKLKTVSVDMHHKVNLNRRYTRKLCNLQLWVVGSKIALSSEHNMVLCLHRKIGQQFGNSMSLYHVTLVTL